MGSPCRALWPSVSSPVLPLGRGPAAGLGHCPLYFPGFCVCVLPWADQKEVGNTVLSQVTALDLGFMPLAVREPWGQYQQSPVPPDRPCPAWRL